MQQNQYTPPRFPHKLLAWFCPDYLFEEIEGDLIQRFNQDIPQYGERRARWNFFWSAICFLRPGILLRNRISFNLLPFHMISNYFRIAARVMLRNKSYSAINVFGLTFGLTGAMLLGLWVLQEFSYDHFHHNKDRIFNVWNKQLHSDGSAACWTATPRVLAPTLVSDFPAVDQATSFAQYNESYLFTTDQARIVKNTAFFVDESFLSIFTFPAVSGDPAKALSNPNSIVLTERFAKNLFGDKDALGESLTLSQGSFDVPFTVSAVLKDLPANTDFNFDFLIPFSFIESNFGKETSWSNNSVTTWVKLKEGASESAVSKLIKDLKKKNTNGEENAELFLYPLTKNHLYSRFENGVPAGGRIEIIRMLGILGICLVVIACINFINLSTARAARRSKEVAVRKVTGAIRFSLITQFMCESVLTAAIAGVMALTLAFLLLPLFNTLIGQQLVINLKDIFFWGTMGAIILCVGLLAGSYPALYLSSFKPAHILKGGWIDANGKSRFRSILVVFQFGFALTLIVSTIVVFKQTVFIQNREMGYEKNNLIYLYLTGDLAKNYEAYKSELTSAGIASSVTRTSTPITQRLSNTASMVWRGKSSEDKTVIERITVDEHIAGTAGVKIIRGRDIDVGLHPTDSFAILLNESAVKAMGFDDPIGEHIQDRGRDWQVVGVVKDFVFTSPYHRVEPIVMQAGFDGEVVHIRMNDKQSVRETLDRLAVITKKFNPDYPFEYHFVDVEYAKKFANVEGTLAITAIFSGAAILIGCLGLLGLSTYMIEARVKEIGIRKVMGGSVSSIMKLLSKTSLKPIVWAIVLFSPGAWFGMTWWLQSFEYRIAFSAWFIIAAAAMILSLAFITIVVQVYKAARVNPVNSLRSE